MLESLQRIMDTIPDAGAEAPRMPNQGTVFIHARLAAPKSLPEYVIFLGEGEASYPPVRRVTPSESHSRGVEPMGKRFMNRALSARASGVRLQ